MDYTTDPFILMMVFTVLITKRTSVRSTHLSRTSSPTTTMNPKAKLEQLKVRLNHIGLDFDIRGGLVDEDITSYPHDPLR